MTSYTTDIIDAANDIQEAGILVEYRSITHTKDTVTPWKNDIVTYVSYNVYIVVSKSKNQTLLNVDIPSENRISSKELGTPIYDYELLLAGNVAFIPNNDDVVILDTFMYKVVDVEIIQPDLEPIMYILKVRK